MNKVDILNHKFVRWTVIAPSEKRGKFKQTLWLCRCECGTEKLIVYGSLVSGDSRSCGCLKLEEFLDRSLKHGKTGTKEYVAWQHFRKRCYDNTCPNYMNYGGRGIKVCERWLESFENFFADMGAAPSRNHSIDRINVNGDYEPSNCRWATPKEQQGNRRDNNWIEYKGDKKILQDWVKELGTSHGNFIRMSKSKGIENTIEYYKNATKNII